MDHERARDRTFTRRPDATTRVDSVLAAGTRAEPRGCARRRVVGSVRSPVYLTIPNSQLLPWIAVNLRGDFAPSPVTGPGRSPA